MKTSSESHSRRIRYIYTYLDSLFIFLILLWKRNKLGALTFSQPRLVMVTNWPARLVLVMIGLLNFLTHIFLVPVTFSQWISRQPLGGGGLVVICDSLFFLLWQFFHPLYSYIVELGANVATSLVLSTFLPSNGWTFFCCSFCCFLTFFFVLSGYISSVCFTPECPHVVMFLCFLWCSIFGFIFPYIGCFCSCFLFICQQYLEWNFSLNHSILNPFTSGMAIHHACF